MQAPALSIPVRANLDAFKQQMNETSSLARTAARKVAQEFLEMNKGLASGAASAAMLKGAQSALVFAGKIALVVGALKLMGDAGGAARHQLQQMVDIADKAAGANFSPEFWQSWVNGAKGAEKQVDLFEGALNHAYQALKPVLNPDWSVWDDGLKKVSAVEQAMREMRELFTTDQDFSGFTLFKNAKTQDQQTIAVLTYMKQLQTIGQDVAALDLGEKLFGASFVDKIRTGQTSVDQLLDNMKVKSADAFSNEIVKRAKALDDELNNAWRTLSQNLHPSLEAIDNIVLSIKGEWVKIVQLMGDAVALSNKIRPGSGPNGGVSAFDLDQQTLLQNRLNDTGLTPQQRSGVEKQLHDVQSRIAQAQASLVPEAPVDFSYGGNSAVPLPKRRPDDAPKPPKPAAAAGPDRFDTSADAIAKRISALQAEAAAIDLGTEARDKAKIAAQLETVAKQANAAAGKGNNVVTEEQRKIIDEVSAAYGRATLAMEKAKVTSQIKFAKDTAFLPQEDVAIAAQLKGIYPDVASALSSVEAAGIRAANGMREIANVGQQVNQSFWVEYGQNLRNGMNQWDAFKNAGLNALGKIADKLTSMAADQLWKAAFGGIGGGSGGFNLFSLFGGGGGAASATMGLGGLAAIHHGGYGPGDHFSTRTVSPTLFRNAPRLHGGAGPGERAAILRTDESVLTPGQMRQLAPAGSSQVQVTVGVSVDDDGKIKAYVANQTEPLQRQIGGLGQALTNQQKAMQSAQRYQATGVS
ncbi:MAG: hypothetical protein J0I08_06710 [Rhizobiales bacterium]|nr:hypothetical protein [Hyphomicrobiales bacterium]